MSINKEYMEESLKRFTASNDHLHTCKVCKEAGRFECEEGKQLYNRWMDYDPLLGEEAERG